MAAAAVTQQMRKTKVAGDWALDVTYDAWVIPGQRWNGFAVPYFDKATAEIVVNDQNLHHRQEPEGYPDWMEWDGDVVCIHNEDSTPTTYERIEPTIDGLYCIGGFNYTWREVAPETTALEVTRDQLKILVHSMSTTAENNPFVDDIQILFSILCDTIDDWAVVQTRTATSEELCARCCEPMPVGSQVVDIDIPGDRSAFPMATADWATVHPSCVETATVKS